MDEFFASPQWPAYMQHMHARCSKVDESDFMEMRKLGKGGFGSVDAGIKLDTAAWLAIKKMDKRLVNKKKCWEAAFVRVDRLSIK